MMRVCRPLLKADAAKMQTLYNLVVGKQSLKDGVPVKDASITKIFGDSWATELKEFAGTLPKAEQTQLDVYLKRMELTKYTREELTTYGILSAGPGQVAAMTEKHMLTMGKARLEELVGAEGQEAGTAAFKAEVAKEAAYANWTPAQATAFANKVAA
mmetsp:Transcript_107924/g.186109  ORF Transcript_107924/g.186109 Transcript_107924/m.186109 type:complete len:157 (-) Transcript_107924:401-871(-)